ncbi:MAG: PQQ-binding-like beta-propeller repeat protein [Bryobacteraceae bacterium]|nr:PQQ-binding-like beta-propeller repeat protein [Bryobacteraceae bacterium]
MATGKCVAMALTAALWLLPATAAGNWPHWRGPDFGGVSDEKDLPAKWSHEENITWKVPLPAWSGATPIIWGDRIFLNVADSGNIQLWCVDRNKAAVVWKKHLSGGDEKRRKQNMSSPSPVTDGKTVWVMTGTGILKAFDFSGQERWARDIQKDYGKFGLNHGYASSPFLYDGDLIVQVLHGMLTDDPSYILRIDGASGKTKWRVERPTDAQRESPDSYTTPALWRKGQTTQLIITGGDYVTGHEPATGKELWRQGGLNPEKYEMNRIIASPVVFGEMIYVPTRRKPLQAFRMQGPSKPERVWTFDAGPDVPTPVTDGKYLYTFDDRGIAHCLDARTGATIWGPERIPSATYSASPVLADGKLYMSSEEGLTTVVRAGPKFEILAQNQLDGYTLSSPAISEGQIFLRTANWLYCVGKRRMATSD